MRSRALHLALLVAGLVSTAIARADEPVPDRVEGPARVLTFDECVSTAVARNIESRTRDVDVHRAESGVTESRSHLLPMVDGSIAALRWKSYFGIPLPLPGGLPTITIPAHDDFTWTGELTVREHLTGLLVGIPAYEAQRLGVDVATLEREATRRDAAFHAAALCLRVLEGKRLVAVADASVRALEGQEKIALSMFANGALAKNDLLRAQLGLSDARLRQIRAEGNVVIERGRVAAYLDLPRGNELDVAPVGDAAQADSTVMPSVRDAESQSRNRIEIRAFRTRVEAANDRVDASWARLLPQVDAVGTYRHFHGSVLEQDDAAFVGAVGTWDIWDWGEKYSAVDEAKDARDAATLAREKIEVDVRLEARQAAVEARDAHEALDVARLAVERAEENYRIVSHKFEQASGTAFDLVDAESLLSTSRAELESASYGWLIARLNVERATGALRPQLR